MSTTITNGVLIPGNGCGRNLNGCMWYPWIAEKLTSSKVAVVGGGAEEEKNTNTNYAKTTGEYRHEGYHRKICVVKPSGKGTVDAVIEEDTPTPICRHTKSDNITINLKGFPNDLEAFEHVWKPFAIDKLGLNEHSILIGHSSGAACSLRLMEDMPIAACCLVAAYNSDLGDELERDSGYFSRPFDYDKMVANCPIIVQFHSKSDHLVPFQIAREVSEGLKKASEAYNKKLDDEEKADAAAAGPKKRRHTYVYVETIDDGHFQDDEYDDVLWPALKKVIPFSS